ncbi:DUF4124 domain-containing protein [Candidatus Accumulibacter sp. ACC003]|uniref:DUF4124 domain-containing protein n=1 Tax=Candidatus Accumulibacter sp. ACC003 TaxID=2823334 RepID=UPI0025C0A33E|nr:DUF4124 domain-containing protein [Candidatus Accumulibacter sp. ACC003]
MLKYLLILAAAAAGGAAAAQVYKCKGPDGKVQFSDTLCKAAHTSEAVPDRMPVTRQQQSEAQQRARQMQDEAAALDQQPAATLNAGQDASRSSARQAEPQLTSPTPVANNEGADAERVRLCIRDVERQAGSQKLKAEMITACRTAGPVQRATGTSESAVSDCVKNVERTGAAGKVKARQIAICHGGDVPPEPLPPPRPRPTSITSCDRGGCWDDVGNRYNSGGGGTMFRNDGKACQKIGDMLQCN